ncbi:MAG: RNA polymerase factor sigma-54 [Firmicutes bacterium]|nr:RNA polymerase factor sigma-54 [Bacillota bacterium]
MRLGYDLTIEQAQKLVMTPELIQAIQILQFNTQELEAYVDEQVLVNPILEIDPQGKEGQTEQEPTDREYPESSGRTSAEEEFDWAEHFKEREYDDISYKQWQYAAHNPENSEYTFEQFVSTDVSLTENLLVQLQFVPMKKNCRMAAKYVIEALDENGYLTQPIEEVARQFHLTEERAEEILKIIQSFDPIGVGARDLKECLKIQLRHQGNDDPVMMMVVDEHLEDIANNRLGNMARALNITVREAQEISDVIRKLEPKPGRQFSGFTETRYVIPDVTVEKVDGEYVVLVNESSTPRLTLSPYYQKMLAESDKESNISQFLTSRLNSAVWLIKSIEQRKQTIYNVVNAVVKYQVDFFEHGPKHMKTLTLKQIADEVGIHESTVSRSINGKYMQSPRGIFEIKYFFTSGVSGSSGEGIASQSIKTLIREIVDNEDPRAPKSDQAMVEILKEKGIDISRRTVAKYRDEMHVASSSKRKRY